jgi:hypothetical protein
MNDSLLCISTALENKLLGSWLPLKLTLSPLQKIKQDEIVAA